MKGHNHVWRWKKETAKEELLKTIKQAGNTGRWLRGMEYIWAEELEKEGLITLCCHRGAAKINNPRQQGI